MRYSELANRYATAIYDLAKASKDSASVLSMLMAFSESLESDKQCKQFVDSPLIAAGEKEKAIKAVLASKNITGEIGHFILLLAKKGRLNLLPEIVSAYQACEDKEKSITRGVVRSTSALSEKQKAEITQTITTLIKKNVILNFVEDKTLIGGLVAQVGSLTFDDSLTAHLDRIKDVLNRRVH